MNSPKIAFVYDRVNKIGGAEKVLTSLHQIWPNAPLYTSVYNPKRAPWTDNIKVIPSFLQKIPFTKNNHEWLFMLMPYAFESFNFDTFDIVISVTSAQAKGIITKPNTLHINYLLTPTKYLYSQRDIHLNHNPFGGVGKVVLNYLWEKEKRWDQVAAQRPDLTVAISEFIAKSSEKYYHKKTDKVIFPPVDTGIFSSPSSKPNQTDYYLLVSRLVPSKRVDVAIKAFNKLGKTLVIVGTGSEKRKLKKISKKNIIFTGQISLSKLVGYYQNCKAFIYPAKEDFGIVMVEALAAGKPVIAYKEGAASEIISSKKYGLLFDRQTPSSIMKVIQSSTKIKFSQAALKERAQEFDSSVFEDKFKQFVEESWQKHQKKI
jgi:glycosyltransferase involved in cell wall biosynthesis